MYLGESPITFLKQFIFGYNCGLSAAGKEYYTTCLDGFDEFVHKYYNTCLTKGWADLILEHSANEKEALEKFFELFDEHLASNSGVKNDVSYYSLDANRFKGEYHYGVLYEGKVYCNVHQQGLPLTEWVGYFTKLGFGLKMRPGENEPIVSNW